MTHYSLTRPARLMLTVLGGLALVSLWLFVVAGAQSDVQAARPFQPCNAKLAIMAGSHLSTSTVHSDVITGASDPSCIKADLAVTKTVNNATPDVGEAITYTIIVTNHGPDDATGVQPTDVLPADVTLDSVTPSQGNCSGVNTITCDLGPLPKGATATVTIVVTPTKAGTITNTVSVTGNEPDADPSNNVDEEIVTASDAEGADLAVTKTVNNATPSAGEAITYTITVTNNGPDDATGVQLTDILPAAVIFGGYTATRGAYISATSLWEMEDGLPASGVVTLTITTTVNHCTNSRAITNTASISSTNPPDPITSNNKASVVITPASVAYCIYLPIVFKDYEPLICNPYFDDFSDSNSGWPIDSSGNVQTGYSAGEEYFISRSVSGMRIVQAPTSFTNRYTVEVDARWDSASIGYEYGLIFGQTNFPVPTYRFGVDAVNQRYRLRYHNGSSWECINQSDPCWVASPFINTGSAPNHLRAECDGITISLYANNNLLWQDSSNIPSCTGQVGLLAQSISTDPATVYFDNFQVSCPFGMSSLNILESNVSLVSTMSADLDVDE